MAVDSGTVLLYDKPAGVTSHDVVARVRRERGQKTGHAGTLDPFATGLLIILLGREATRLQTGALPPDPLELPTGPILQRPPAYSAVKVGGVRAYKLARRGEDVELPERAVTVHRFDLVWRRAERAEFEIE